MSVESFKAKYIKMDSMPGTSSLELKGKATFLDDFLYEDNKDLKQVLYNILEDMRFKLLRNIDEAFRELEKD